MMKIALGMSIHDPYPGAPINVIAISLKTFFGSVKEFCSMPNPVNRRIHIATQIIGPISK